MLHRFVYLVQVQRQDFTGRMLTVRSSELAALAAIFNTPIEYTAHRLDELGLRFESVRE